MTGCCGLLGNVLWVVFGGWLYALEYFMGGVFMMLTIVGIPFGFSLWKLAALALWPFGKTTDVERVTGCRVIFNVIWVVFFGWVIALTHLLFAALFAITIIGIPFAIQNIKLAKIALWPLGTKISSSSGTLPI
ncbi:hypothetical protein BB561_006850 [Smittium simulii]|uniref:Inner membrane component domain-containing protein n=1 Tax=Smittium simulii TaxID=133385 RepID=A0A2T9Y0T9_9FUNG|nr:hypothetical protein BB561_006854 [Smittium simulii]PVU85978.1 hypothetical protein BB561_006850 [Smittium simulii]